MQIHWNHGIQKQNQNSLHLCKREKRGNYKMQAMQYLSKMWLVKLCFVCILFIYFSSFFLKDRTKHRLVYIPVHMTVFEYKEKKYKFVENAVTGQIYSEKPFGFGSFISKVGKYLSGWWGQGNTSVAMLKGISFLLFSFFVVVFCFIHIFPKQETNYALLITIQTMKRIPHFWFSPALILFCLPNRLVGLRLNIPEKQIPMLF